MAEAECTQFERGVVGTHLPGYRGIWVFVMLDLLFFAMLFLSYGIERASQVDLFNQSQALLNLEIGLINMLVLLTSSWFVAMAVHAVRHGRSGRGVAWLSASLVSGLVFVVLKVIEYGHKFAADISLLSNDFFMFYFTMTFFHLLHVLVGLGVLSVLILRTRRQAYASGNTAGLESGGVYWHMVDLLWIIMFPLLYMAR